jgi:hypothetical protein
MSKVAGLPLSDFLAHGHQTEVLVQVPHRARFRVQLRNDGPSGPFHLARHKDIWWLLHPDMIDMVPSYELWRAELYEAVYDDGQTFVIPVTYPRPGKEGWGETLTEAVHLATKQWVSIESDHENCRYLISADAKKWRAEPNFCGCDFGDLIDLAFEGRIITTREQAFELWPRKRRRRTISESYED